MERDEKMTEEGKDAEAALALIRETQRAAAARAKAPAWYHPAVGAVLFTLVAALEVPGAQPFSGLALIALAILVTQYRRQTGTWSNGYTTGSAGARRLLLLGTAAIFAAILFAVWLKFHRHVDGAMIAAGILVGLFSTWLGFAWERAFVRDAGA
jgi:hypothetical protein